MDWVPPARLRPPLSGDMNCDVCIVGGGYTGLSAAIHLAAKGARITLVEARSAGFAASGRNGGQIHTGFRREQADLEKWLGPGHAGELWRLAKDARGLLDMLITQNKISCDLHQGILLAAHNSMALRALARDAEHLHHAYDHPTKMLDADKVRALTGSKNYLGGRLDERGGQLHPLKFIRGLADAAEQYGVLIHENTPARSISRNVKPQLRCDRGTISADHVLIACDAFCGTLVPELAQFIGHIEGFQIATAPLDAGLDNTVLPGGLAVADTRFAPDYYRKTPNGRLIFGGGERYWTMPDDNALPVRPHLTAVFPQLAGAKIDHAWRGTIGVTRTRMPHAGKLSERILFAHGYSGQGLALSLLYGNAMAEAVLGHSEHFDSLARIPAKPFPGGAALRKPLMAAGLLLHKMLDAI